MELRGLQYYTTTLVGTRKYQCYETEEIEHKESVTTCPATPWFTPSVESDPFPSFLSDFLQQDPHTSPIFYPQDTSLEVEDCDKEKTGQEDEFELGHIEYEELQKDMDFEPDCQYELLDFQVLYGPKKGNDEMNNQQLIQALTTELRWPGSPDEVALLDDNDHVLFEKSKKIKQESVPEKVVTEKERNLMRYDLLQTSPAPGSCTGQLNFEMNSLVNSCIRTTALSAVQRLKQMLHSQPISLVPAISMQFKQSRVWDPGGFSRNLNTAIQSLIFRQPVLHYCESS